MPKERKKSRRLTVFLLKETVDNPDDALEPEEKKTRQTLAFDPQAGVDGAFFWASRPPVEPGWVAFVRPFVGQSPDGLKTASASGLLVLKASERFFAVTFGYGRSLLDLDKIEPQFGLKVCLNRIDPAQMRSMDTKTYEDVVVAKRTQVSKNSDIPAFGIDVSSDILRAVTGTPHNQEFAKTLSGSDSLVVNRPLEPAALADFCGELLAAFQDDSYKDNFGWIDDLKPVVDKTMISHLDELVVEQLKSGDTSYTYLAVPDVIDWEDLDAFRITGTRNEEYADLDLDEYLANLGNKCQTMRLGDLKSRSVSVRFTRTGEFSRRWKLYQCLVSEQRIGGQLHVLMEGRWFAIADSLVGEVDSYCASLPSAKVPLPPASSKNETEGDYNKRLADSDPTHLLHLDAKIRRPGGASSGIELCDVLTIDGEFIHVKKKSRSSTLSHLFAQGSVSAETFIGDGVFRDKIRAEIAKRETIGQQQQWLDLVPPSNQSVNRATYTVSYAVITANTGQSWLPFFSKLNLMQHGRLLENLGVKVSISRIDAGSSAMTGSGASATGAQSTEVSDV